MTMPMQIDLHDANIDIALAFIQNFVEKYLCFFLTVWHKRFAGIINCPWPGCYLILFAMFSRLDQSNGIQKVRIDLMSHADLPPNRILQFGRLKACSDDFNFSLSVVRGKRLNRQT